MKKSMRIIALTITIALLLTILPLSAFADVFEDTLGGGDISGDLGYYELGDVTGDGVIDEDDATFIQEFDAGYAALTSEQIAAGDVNFDGITDAGDAILILRYADGQIDSFIPKPQIDSTEDMANFFNELTADAENMSYDWSRESYYTDSVDFGSITSILDGIIKGVDANASLDSVIGGFFGLGSKSGEVVNGEMSDDAYYPNYALKAMNLTKNDINSWSINGNRYIIRLNDCTNPQRNGYNVLKHANIDFITVEDVNESIAETVGSAVTISSKDSSINYKNIFLTAIVINNELTNFEILYDTTFSVKVKVGLTATGTGATQTRLVYANFR